MREKKIIIKKETNQRSGWDEEFKKANSIKENSLIDGDGMNLSAWDEKEWKWYRGELKLFNKFRPRNTG